MLKLKQLVFLAEVELQYVAHTDAGTGNLVGIGGADALQRRADLGIALGLLVGGVEQSVRRQNKVSLLRDIEVVGRLHILLAQSLNLSLEYSRLDEHAIAYDIKLFLVKDAGRNDMEHVLYAIEFKGVARVGTTLKTGYDIVSGRQNIDNLAFSFVAPLQS